MPYEPGSTQCRGLIAAKESLLIAMSSLNNIENIDQIISRLKEIYKELDEIHEGRRVIENRGWYFPDAGTRNFSVVCSQGYFWAVLLLYGICAQRAL